MIYSWGQRIARFLINFLQFQLFIQLVSLPIFVAWGIPISLCSFLGNLLFAPILTLFLCISSLIFFSALLHIPHGFLIQLLEYITTVWLWLISWHCPSWCIGFAQPPWIILVLIIGATIGALHLRIVATPTKRVIAFAGIALISFILLRNSASPLDMVTTFACHDKEITIINTHNQLMIIDQGAIGRRLSACSWAEYTLLPHLIKTTGKTSIDHLICLTFNKTLLEAVTHLAHKSAIKHVYIPYFEGSLSPATWRSYFSLKKACTKYDVQLHRLSSKSMTIRELTITPTDKRITYQDCSYPTFYIYGQIGTHIIDNKKATL